MAPWTLVNTGSGDGLLADGTKPLPEAMLTYQWGPVSFINLTAVALEKLKNVITTMHLDIAHLRVAMRYDTLKSIDFKKIWYI